ncbi:hypothetical protein [Brachybacterium phenoliresistens]|uniref:hypothetical protein n=1 Tax=Brachybacterium phenoliresistens TaxID=396014 RepID=UPI0012EC8497|nr:hypothetical protein [Brachybacterium phenoliresistens]
MADLLPTDEGLVPRFDAAVVQSTIDAVHEPRGDEWEALTVPTLAIFAKHGMVSGADKDELIRRRPETDRTDLGRGGRDAHLDAFDEWIDVLRRRLSRGRFGESRTGTRCRRSVPELGGVPRQRLTAR